MKLLPSVKELDGKTLELTYYCEKDICLLVGMDEEENVYILHEEINREGGVDE